MIKFLPLLLMLCLGCSHVHQINCYRTEYHDCGENAREGWACVEIETPVPCNITKWWQQ